MDVAQVKSSLAVVSLVSGSVLAAWVGTCASSADYFGPLTSVGEVSVEVGFDDSPELGLQRGDPMIDPDSNEATQLRVAIVAAARQRLQQGGLVVTAATRNLVRFSIQGGRFKAEGDNLTNVFVVESEVCLADDAQCSMDRRILGVSDTSHLQERLVEAAATIIDDFVNGRARWRQSRKAR